MLWLQFVHIVNGKLNVRVRTVDCRSFVSVALIVPFNSIWVCEHIDLRDLLKFPQGSFWQCRLYQTKTWCIFHLVLVVGGLVASWNRAVIGPHLLYVLTERIWVWWGNSWMAGMHTRHEWNRGNIFSVLGTQHATCFKLIITALCSVPLDDSSAGHFYGHILLFLLVTM